MSIEKLIEGLTAAVEENTEQRKRIADLLEAGGKAKAKAGAEDDDKPTRGRKKAEDDEDDEKPTRGRKKADDDEDDEKPAKKGGKADKPKKLKIADVRAALADLMSSDDQDAVEEAEEFVAKMLKHLKVKKASEIEEADFEDVLRWTEDAKENGVPRKPKFD